jgi:hypothetical protein
MYDVKTVALNAELRQSQVIIAQQKHMTLAQAPVIGEVAK